MMLSAGWHRDGHSLYRRARLGDKQAEWLPGGSEKHPCLSRAGCRKEAGFVSFVWLTRAGCSEAINRNDELKQKHFLSQRDPF